MQYCRHSLNELPMIVVRGRFRILMTVFLTVTAGCTSSTEPGSAMSVEARTYLENIVSLMEQHSINRAKIDWTAFRDSVYNTAPAAQTVQQLAGPILTALRLLNDGHSQYISKSGQLVFYSTHHCVTSFYPPRQTPANVGYVIVHAFSGSGAAATAFADDIQNAIKAADRQDLIGWVVDLRSNGGGNMWPMIAGLGPILGDGTLGYFIDPLGSASKWEFHDGAAWLDGVAIQRTSSVYRLLREPPRVAVLTDNGIASSGEATFIAFRGRANTRSFGVATCGLSTANSEYALSDGATLVLTVAVMADRLKNPYGTPLSPDEVISDSSLVYQRAIQWLQSGQ